MSAVMGLWTQIVALATTTEIAMLVVAVVIIAGAGMIVQNGSALISATVGALAVFGLANYAQGVVLQGQNAAASAEAGWQKLIDMHVGVLIAYFVVFLVLITFTFFARNMIFSR